MPFAAEDVYAGMIAYFRIKDLMRHRRIRHTHTSPDGKPRPFICYAEAEGLTYWTYFTGTPNPQRRTGRASGCATRRDDSRLAYTGDLIIGDAGNTFVGPAEAFAECSRKHDECKGLYRPMLLPEGVMQVQQMVSSRGGLLPRIKAAGREAQAQAA